MRLFLGIQLSQELRNHLQQAWSGVEGLPKHLKTIPSQNWHMTLAFLDEIPEDKVEVLAELLAQVTDKPPIGALLVDRFEAFPKKKPTRIAARAVPVAPKSWSEYVDRIRDFASIVAPDMDRKPWSPHITLARSEKGLILPSWNSSMTDFAWIPEEFAIFKSTQSAEGSKYEPLYTYRIGI